MCWWDIFNCCSPLKAGNFLKLGTKNKGKNDKDKIFPILINLFHLVLRYHVDGKK